MQEPALHNHPGRPEMIVMVDPLHAESTSLAKGTPTEVLTGTISTPRKKTTLATTAIHSAQKQGGTRWVCIQEE